MQTEEKSTSLEIEVSEFRAFHSKNVIKGLSKKILELFHQSASLSFTDIHQHFPNISKPTISAHLRQLTHLNLIKELSGYRILNKRRYEAIDELKNLMQSLDIQQPSLINYLMLKEWSARFGDKKFPVKKWTWNFPFQSRSQHSRHLHQMSKEGWVTIVAKDARGCRYRVNIKKVQELTSALARRAAFFDKIYPSMKDKRLKLPIIPTFYFSSHRYLHFFVLQALTFQDRTFTLQVDLQRMLFLSESEIRTILQDLADLQVLDTIRSETAKLKKIMLFKERVRQLLCECFNV